MEQSKMFIDNLKSIQADPNPQSQQTKLAQLGNETQEPADPNPQSQQTKLVPLGNEVREPAEPVAPSTAGKIGGRRRTARRRHRNRKTKRRARK